MMLKLVGCAPAGDGQASGQERDHPYASVPEDRPRDATGGTLRPPLWTRTTEQDERFHVAETATGLSALSLGVHGITRQSSSRAQTASSGRACRQVPDGPLTGRLSRQHSGELASRTNSGRLTQGLYKTASGGFSVRRHAGDMSNAYVPA